MEIKLDHPVTTTPLVFLDQLSPKHPKSHNIEPNRLASPGGNSSPPGSSSEKPRKKPRTSYFYPRRLAVQPIPPGASSNKPKIG